MPFISPCNVPVKVTRCHNLSNDAYPHLSSLSVCTAPALYTGLRGCVLDVFELPDAAGYRVIMVDVSRKSLSVTIVDDVTDYERAFDGQPVHLRDFASPVTSVVSCRDSFKVYCADGSSISFYANPVDDEQPWVPVDMIADLPSFSAVAVPGTNIEVSIPRHVLRDTYDSQSQRLSDVDYLSVSTSLKDAYRAVAEEASATGVFFQPVLVAYRFLDLYGNDIYTSAPVLLQHPGGSQLASPVVFTVDSDNVLSSASLSASTFTVQFQARAPWHPLLRQIVNTVEILVSPQIHPFDPAESVRYSMNARASSPLTLRVSMPGASRALSSASSSVARSAIAGLLSDFTRVAVAVESINSATLAAASSAEGAVCAVAQGPGMTLDAEIAALRAIRTPARLDDSAQLALHASLPQVMGCTAAARVADLVAYANPLLTTFAGYNPLDHVVQFDTGVTEHWQCYAAVDMADGSTRVVRGCESISTPPTSLSPLISYPSAQAVAYSFVMRCGAVVRSLRVPLTPLPHADIAMYVSPDFKPSPLPQVDDDFVYPHNSPSVNPLQGYVALALASCPHHILAIRRVDSSPVLALCPACNPSGGWDFNRRRLYALGNFGIRMLTTDTAASTFAVTSISSLAVRGAHHVATSASGTVYLLAGNVPVLYSLRRYSLARVPLDVCLPHAVSALVHNPVTDTLWCIPPAVDDDNVEVGGNTVAEPVGDSATASIPAPVEALVVNLNGGSKASCTCYTATVPPIIYAARIAGGMVLASDTQGNVYSFEVPFPSNSRCGAVADLPPYSDSPNTPETDNITELVPVEWSATFQRLPRNLLIDMSASHVSGTLSVSAGCMANCKCNVLEITVNGQVSAPMHLNLPPVNLASQAGVSFTAQVSRDFRLNTLTLS